MVAGGLDVFILSPGMPHGPGTLDKHSLGGSETAAIEVAEALARRGHRLTVFSPCELPGRHRQVLYHPIGDFVRLAQGTPHDVLIVSRAADACRYVTGARQTWLWCHDLLTKKSRDTFRGCLWNVEGVLLLSRFQRQQYVELSGIDTPRFIVTRNGIDLERIAAAPARRRQRKKIMYASRPERGLTTVLEVARRLWDLEPEATICVCGYANFPDHLRDYYAACFQAVEQAPNMANLGVLSKRQLYEHYKSSALLISPGAEGAFAEFREISFIGAMEAMACGCVPVCGAKGAIPETVGNAGVLVGDEDTDSTSRPYLDEFAAATARLLSSDEEWQTLSAAGVERAAALGWDGVAEQWEGLFVAAYQQRAS